MKNIVTLIFTFVIGTNYFIVFAQKVPIISNDSLTLPMQQIAKVESQTNWIKFKESTLLNPKTLFLDFKSAFGLAEDDEMMNYKTEVDDLGFTQHHFKQYYKNIVIDGESFTVHTNKGGSTYAGNGNILTGISLMYLS